MSPSAPTTTTRWCPTPEQLMILEELYRRGLKTPNSSQIQKITSHLSLYGKIQGKNVFYWFQNHKARDRQKMRKKLLQHEQQMMMTMMMQQQHMSYYYQLPTTNYYYPAPNLQPQRTTTAALEAAGGLLMRPTWSRSSDILHKDHYILNSNQNNNNNNHHHHNNVITERDDSVIASHVEVGPTTNHNNGPLQTLDLFPLTSSKHHPNTNNNTVS